MEPLTDRQRHVLKVIIEFIQENEYPPTLRELADALGASSRNSAVKHLQTLHKKGYIYWQEKKARGIKIIESLGMLAESDTREIPVVGREADGNPKSFSEHIESYISIPKKLLDGNDEHFLFRIHGECMNNAGIFENDLVLVHVQDSAEVDSIVVVCIDKERIVKRLCTRKDGLHYLCSDNPLYPDVYLDGDWTILGKVVSLFRENVK